MDPEDLLPALEIGTAHVDLPVEPARPQEGRVQDVRPVGGRQDHHALVAGEAVHLHQELVQGLLPLVVAAAQARAPLAAHGVDLVDEHHGGGHLLGLLKEVPDPAGAHAHVELHEVGAGDGQELDPGLPGHRLGQQGLAGARRAHQQHALGDAGPQVQVLLRGLEEVHDLPQLLLLLVGTGHVGKAHLLLALGAEADLRFAEPPPLVHPAAPLGPDRHVLPQQEHSSDEQHVDQHLAPPGRGVNGIIVVIRQNPIGLLLADQVPQLLPEALHAAQGVGDGGPVLEVQIELVSVPDVEARHLSLLEQVLHLGVGHRGRPVAAGKGVVRQQQQNDRQKIQPHAGVLRLLGQGVPPPAGKPPAVVFSAM